MGKLSDLVASGEATAAPVQEKPRRSLREMVESGEATASEDGSLADEAKTFGAHAADQAAFGFGAEWMGGVKANAADWKRLLSGDISGALKSQWEGLKDLVGEGKGPSLADLVRGRDGASDWTQRYRQERDATQGQLDAMEARNPNAALAGKVTGAVGSGLVLPGGAAAKGIGLGAKLARGAAVGAGQGAVSGLGNSRADLTRGEFGEAAKDTAIGAGFGAAGGALGAGVGELVEAGQRHLPGMAARKLSEAEARAQAMAAEKVAGQNKVLRSSAGGEAQKVSKLAETIRDIEGWDVVPDDPGALEAAARAALDKAAKVRQQAKAVGLDDAVDAKGALLSAGSKADSANKARAMADVYEAGAQRLMERAQQVRAGVASAADNVIDVKALRASVQGSNELRAAENQVLLRALEELPQQRAVAEGARAAYRVGLEQTPERIAKETADLLSGRAAWNALKARLLRYGPPLASSVAGAAFGGPVGAGVGAVAGLAAGRGMEALAGAGMRPALRSFRDLVLKYPAVQRVVWGSVQRLTQQNPQALGKYGIMLRNAGKEGATMARVLHDALLLESPEYAALVAQEAAPDVDAAMDGAQAQR